MNDKLLAKRHAKDAMVGLALGTEAMETLLAINLDDADAETLRRVEKVCNLAMLAGTLTARLQSKLVRETALSNPPLVPLKVLPSKGIPGLSYARCVDCGNEIWLVQPIVQVKLGIKPDLTNSRCALCAARAEQGE